MERIFRIWICVTFTMISSFAFAQKPQEKERIKIVHTYDYYDLYPTKKPGERIDTFIILFDCTGKIIMDSEFPDLGKYTYIDSSIFVLSDGNNTHEKEYWSDSTIIDVYSTKYKDSTILIKISGKDTIQISKYYYSHKTLIRSEARELRPEYIEANITKIYNKNTKYHKIATIITTYHVNSYKDTVKIDNNSRIKLYKTLVYNPSRSEWYVKEKTKYHKRKKIFWETKYHNYHKRYFTTKTTTTYDKSFHAVLEVEYDTYLKEIKTKTTYKYKYY